MFYRFCEERRIAWWLCFLEQHNSEINVAERIEPLRLRPEQAFEKLDCARIIWVIHESCAREPVPCAPRTGIRSDGPIEFIHRESGMTQVEANLGQAGASAVVSFASLPGGFQCCLVLLDRGTKVPLRHLPISVTVIRI